MKKKAFLFCLILFVFSLTACSSGDNIKLTDEESDAIAQYCAYLLLKYDKNKTDDRKLLDVKELQDIYKERNSLSGEETDTDVTPTPSAKPSGKDDKKATPTPKPTQKPDKQENPTPVPTTVPDKNLVKSLTKLYDVDGFKVEYKSYVLQHTYDYSGGSFPSKGEDMDLLIVQFNITNTESSSKKFDYENYTVDYEIILGNGQILKPVGLTAIPNSIDWFVEPEKISAGKTVKAILVFDIAKKDEGLGFTLRATNSSTGKVYETPMK